MLAETVSNLVGLPSEPYSAMAGVIGSDTLRYFLPELIVTIALVLVLLVDISDRLRKPSTLMGLAFIGLLVPMLLVIAKWGVAPLFIYPDWGNLSHFNHHYNQVGYIDVAGSSMLAFDG